MPDGISFTPAVRRRIDLPSFAPAPSAPVVVADTFERRAPIALKRDRPVLLYNDQCEVCRVLSSWVKERDAAGQDLIDEQPIGDDPKELERLGLNIWDVYKEIHLLMPDGSVKKGGAAITEVMKRLPNMSWIALLPQPLINASYKTLDALRPAIGCKSCGGGPVAWWALPVKWSADLFRWVRGLDG